MTVELNDAAAIRAADRLGMLEHQAGYARQLREGRALGEAFALPALPDGLDEVVFLGTGGGSAAAAALLRSYGFGRASVPFELIQGYNVPAHVDRHSLVLALSYSGNTEEILAAFDQARAAGASCLALGTGGRLREAARGAGLPYLEVPRVVMARVALGYYLGPLLVLLARWGLVPDPRPELDEAEALLDALAGEYGPDQPVASNRAKQVATALAGRIPVVYGSADHLDAVAWRIKNQLGENSKLMAFWNVIPHLHHDEVVGWDMPPALMRQLAFLLLRDAAGESVQMQKRWEGSRELLAERAGAVVEVWARGTGLLARMLSLVVLGDYVSCYLAIARGVDPTPVPIIDLLKRKIGQQA